MHFDAANEALIPYVSSFICGRLQILTGIVDFAFFAEIGAVIPQLPPFYRKARSGIIQSYKKERTARKNVNVRQRVIASLLIERAAENKEFADRVGLVCGLRENVTSLTAEKTKGETEA